MADERLSSDKTGSVISDETYFTLKNTLEKHFDDNKYVYKTGDSIPFHVAAFGADEALAFVLPLLEKQVSLGGTGGRVEMVEKTHGEEVGVENVCLCNSGSSANLLAVSSLRSQYTPQHLKLSPGDEVIVPAVAWSTSVWPLSQNQLVPVFVDVDMNTLNIDPVEIEKAITPKTKAILIIHIYGNPCDMDAIMDIVNRHNLILIEDCCEGSGALYGGKAVGSFGLLSSYSFYFSHHITSIEGGALVTPDPTLAQIHTMQRSHGFTRMSTWHKEICDKNPHLKPAYLFADHGYNMRPNEAQAAMLCAQMKKLPQFLEIRKAAAKQLDGFFSKHKERFWMQTEYAKAESSKFGYPVVVKPGWKRTGNEIIAHLKENDIPTRPVIAGNIVRHPGCNGMNYRVSGELTNADRVLSDGFVLPIHQGVTEEMAAYMISVLEKFVN